MKNYCLFYVSLSSKWMLRFSIGHDDDCPKVNSDPEGADSTLPTQVDPELLGGWLGCETFVAVFPGEGDLPVYAKGTSRPFKTYR
ncbi:unnamed protein product [Camellia sinensis]